MNLVKAEVDHIFYLASHLLIFSPM